MRIEYLNFRGIKYRVTQANPGDPWFFGDGTRAAIPPDFFDVDPNDLGDCGVGFAQTGSWDPSHPNCIKHDNEFNAVKRGEHDTPSNFVVTRDFVEGEGKTFLASLYGVVSAPIYVVLGGGIGWLRRAYLQVKNAVQR